MTLKITDRARYPEPDTETELFEQVVRADGVWRGDKVNGHKVAKVKSGTKWTELRNSLDTLIRRVENDTEVVVLRERQTKASRDADRDHDRNLRLIKEYEDGLPTDLDTQVEKLVREVADYRQADYNRIGQIMEAQAELKVWRRWFAVIEHQNSDDNKEPFEGTLWELHEKFCEQLREELLTRYVNRAISRSTNAVANLMEDCDREAKAMFLDRTRWF